MWEQALARFNDKAEVEPAHWWKRVNQDDPTALKQRLQRAAQNEELLEHWLEYRRLRKRLADLGFEAVIFAVENQTVPAESTKDACLLGLMDLWAKQILESNPTLGQFSGKDQEAIRVRFAEIDNQLTKLQREQLAAKIDQHKVPEGNNSGKVKDRTQLALLKHEAGKKTRHESIRSLMLRAPEALQGLKPCFMMSPMAVAQYLPAGKVHFDIIVMDEASQMRPEEALGAISRGSQLVVVGDPKQLPPTSFFSAKAEMTMKTVTKPLAQDSESILEAAMPLFKLRRLRWHYRSRHESLIAFSNKAFYDSNPVVYPSPHRESNEFGVKFVRVARGRFVEQRNVEEADIVAKAIEHHLLHRPEESLGVVAMNVKQAEQIDRALEQLAKQNPALQEAFSRNEESDEPLFIKNLRTSRVTSVTSSTSPPPMARWRSAAACPSALAPSTALMAGVASTCCIPAPRSACRCSLPSPPATWLRQAHPVVAYWPCATSFSSPNPVTCRISARPAEPQTATSKLPSSKPWSAMVISASRR